MRALNLNPFYFINQKFPDDFFNFSLCNRVVQVALPFLNLYQPLAMVTGVGLGTAKSWVHLNDLATHLKAHQWKSGAKDSVFLAVSVISAAGIIFHSRLVLALTISQELLNEIHTIYQTVREGQYEECALASLKTVQHSLHLASIIAPTPQILLISAIVQTVFKVIQSAKEFENGRYFEGTTHLILSIFYGYQCGKQLRLYSQQSRQPQVPAQILENPIQILTNDEVVILIQKFEVYKKNHSPGFIDFKSFLKDNNYSTHFAYSDFSQIHQNNSYKNEIFSYVDFDNVIFRNCDFRGLNFTCSYFQGVCFYRCQFDDVLFRDCRFHYSSFNSSKFNNSSFNYSELIESDFIGSKFNKCLIKKTNFSSANFKDSRWKECAIKSSDFADTLLVYGHFESTKMIKTNLNYANFYGSTIVNTTLDTCSLTGTCFLDAQAQKTIILNCNLTDCLLLNAKDQIQLSDCTENIVTRPVIGIPCNYEQRGVTNPVVFASLKKFGAIPVKFDGFPPTVDPVKLHFEVATLLESASVDDCGKGRSLPQYILDSIQAETSPFPSEIKKLYSFAQHLTQYSDAIFIPGGPDVEPEFYGARKEENTKTENDCRRTLVEFSLFREAKRLNTPILGVCRGAQIGAIYHGGRLKQHIESEHGAQCYQIEGGNLKRLVGNEIKGLSMHHQAIIEPGDDLLVTVRNGEVIKALEHPRHPLFLFQFHIEQYKSDYYSFYNRKDNKIIMSYFISLANNHRSRDRNTKALARV